MNTSTKKMVKKLVEDWLESPDEGYFVYHGMIEACLMDLNPVTEAYGFFKAVEAELRVAMKETPTGLKSYNDFITALQDHKEVWL